MDLTADKPNEHEFTIAFLFDETYRRTFCHYRYRPLTHPHRMKTDQHAVVTFTLPNAPVTLLGVICQVGIEPTDAAPRVTRGAIQRSTNFSRWQVCARFCSLSGYRLYRLSGLRFHTGEISDQFSLPVRFLNAGVKLAVLLCEFISAFLDLDNVDRPDVLHFRTREELLGNRGRLGQVGENSPT